VATGSGEDNCVALNPVDEKKITSNMTLAMVFPVARKRVVHVFFGEHPIIRYDQQHDSFY